MTSRTKRKDPRALANEQEELERLQSKADALFKRLAEDDSVLRCSFCQKSQNDVEKLIGGPKCVYICSECVDICNEIIADDRRLSDLKH